MPTIRVTISPEAAQWILKQLSADGTESQLADMTPTLCFSVDYQKRDENGRVFERHLSPFFDIGWYTRDYLSRQEFPEIDVLGQKLLVRPDAYAQLDGKRLVLKCVDVGFPNQSDITCELLKAV